MQGNALAKLEPAAQAVVRRPHILVVDDDASQTEVLRYRLDRLGFDVSCANSGAAAISMASESRPHLVLLDLRLPDIDGLDVCQKLADLRETCDIPVIIVSGVEAPDIVRRARAAGCRYCVRKPYDPNALLVLMENSMRNDEF